MAEIDTELQAGIEEGQEPQLYELGYHLLPTLSEEELPEEVGALKDCVEKHRGVIVSDQSPRMFTLAYSVAKIINEKRQYFDTAFFGWIKFRMAPSDMLECNKELKHNKNILRYILIKTIVEKVVPPKKMTFLKKKHDEVGVAADVGKKATSGAVLSEEELDKTIEELVAE